MINLIPPSAQKQVKHEYWIRVASVWMILIGSAFLVVSILMAPVYMLVTAQLKSFSFEYTQANIESQSFKDSETKIITSNEIASLLAKSEGTTAYTTIIKKLESLAGEDIIITDFDLSRKAGVISPVVISGEADSRLALTQFQDAIQGDEMFSGATLPISNLAKDRDIPFTITVDLNKKIQN
jgi:hypothetical protein